MVDILNNITNIKKDENSLSFEYAHSEKNQYLIECNLLEDSGSYSIHVTDILNSEVNPYNDNEVMEGLFDSDGGSDEGFEILWEDIPLTLEKKILIILFGDNSTNPLRYRGLIKQHWEQYVIIKDVRKSVINLMNELEQSDGEAVDLFLEVADLATLTACEHKLIEWKKNEPLKIN